MPITGRGCAASRSPTKPMSTFAAPTSSAAATACSGCSRTMRALSGVSYVIENRHMMLRAFPDLVDGAGLRPVEDYGSRLVAAMRELAPAGCRDPQIVLLSPGIYNSAYFEHVFLAREMGVPLVEGSDLVVEQDRVY